MTMYHHVLNNIMFAFLKHNSIKKNCIFEWFQGQPSIFPKLNFQLHFKNCLLTKILFQKIYIISFQIKMTSYILVSYSPLIFLGGISWLSCSKYCSARWEMAS